LSLLLVSVFILFHFLLRGRQRHQGDPKNPIGRNAKENRLLSEAAVINRLYLLLFEVDDNEDCVQGKGDEGTPGGDGDDGPGGVGLMIATGMEESLTLRVRNSWSRKSEATAMTAAFFLI
jgi:hypothetical protein